MRLLVFSTLFPYPGVPHHGVFVRERLRHYLARHGGEATVIAPVPFVPRALARGRYASFADVPEEEQQDGLRVLHPRYALLPRVGMSSAPLTLGRCARRTYRRLQREGQRFDLLDAHYLYPDAVAAAFLAGTSGLPLVVTARGTDLNLIPRYAIPRAWLRWMLRRAAAAITVAAALQEALEPLRPPTLPVRVLGNGVDLHRFRPQDRSRARADLGWDADAATVLSVGHLIERKGHHHLLAALPELPGVQLKIVGAGEWDERLRRQAAELGVAERVEFVGTLPHERLRVAYAAADVLALLSSREGWPNVLLESMACGTPVVATRVWGSPEVVRSERVGVVVDGTAPTSVAAAVRELLERPRDRSEVRRYAEQHSWDRVADGMQEVFEAVLQRDSTAQHSAVPATGKATS